MLKSPARGLRNPILPLCCLLIVILLSTSRVGAQATAPGKITVTGTTRDTTGLLLRSINIVVKGNQKIGTSSDENGRFILDVPAGSILEFSSIGFETLDLNASREPMNVVLRHLKKDMSEVVVTAFGKKQSKEAVVGSVTTIDPADLKIPSSNLTTALAGQVAGVIAFQRTGQPGGDNAAFFVRGVTTFGYSASPLILIDNIELTADDLARLQVDDIASFSILKDASAAALYGARGANGVILVTTKEGKIGKAKVNVRVENSISKPTRNLQLADPITYMNDYNEATTTRNPQVGPFFTPNEILSREATVKHAPGSNPYVYPAVDWMHSLFRPQTTTQRANFSVSGGTNFAKYYIAGSYNRDNGILQVNPVNNFNSGMKFENYQLRSNINVNVTKTTEIVVRLWGNFNDYTGPITSDPSGATDLYSKALHTSPVAFPAYYPPDSANLLTHHILFGNSIATSGSLQDNPYADLMYGYENLSQSRMSAQFELNQNFGFLTKGLSFHGIFNTNRYSSFNLNRAYKPYYYDIGSYNQTNNTYTLNWLNNAPGGAQEFLSYTPGVDSIVTFLYLQGSVDYARTFGKHSISSTVLATREQTLYANEPSLQASLPYRNVGVSGRATYSFASRYFLEYNFGLNASERFSTQHRWGFFPTVGAGWVISNEDFWANGGKVTDIITRLKLRGSYGLVGNDNIGSQRFYYLSSVSVDAGPSATFGSTNGFGLHGTSIQAYPNPNVTWEVSQKANLAVEMTILKKLNIVAEIYHEYRYDILENLGYVPNSDGLEAPIAANQGTAYSKGLDLSLDYKQNFTKDLWLIIRANLTATQSKYGRFEEPQYTYPWEYTSGTYIGQARGYIAERLFVDDKEAANSPTQIFNSSPPPMGGDIKYRDINKDGVIDAHDEVPLGLPTTPEVIYGFGFSAGYKNFDLSAFFQGLGRESFYIDPSSGGTAPFVNNAQLLTAYANNHWSEANQNLYALYPRLSTVDVINNEQPSTWWMRNGSFLRLKSLEAGYSLPKRWIKPLRVETVRFYFNGLNLFTWSSFKLWDPEMGGNGLAYPIQKVLNLGVNVNF
jgi:TonB-linked SusC/RagA family outer membrane protein